MSDSELVFILFGVCLFLLIIFHQRNAAPIGGEMWRRDHSFGGYITRVQSSDFPPKAVSHWASYLPPQPISSFVNEDNKPPSWNGAD